MVIRHVISVLTLGLMLAGCAGNGPVPTGGGSPYDGIQTIFNANCVSSSCHSSVAQQGSLVLEEGVSYGNLINVVPANEAASAAGLKRVVPGNTDMSFLLIKLTGPSLGEGGRMPLGFPPLSQADIDEVTAWILAGAPGPGGGTPTSSPTLRATETSTVTATATVAPSATVTPSPSMTPSGTLPPTATTTASPTPAATFTPTPSPSSVPTPTFSLDSTFPQIQAAIFNVTCLDLGCHNSTDRAGGQSLAAGEAYAQLVGVSSSNEAAVQDGLLRVRVGDPEKSFLITKLTLPTVFDVRYASRMPLAKPVLSPDQIEHVRAWILRGALADETP